MARAIGEPERRPKWFGVPTGMLSSGEVGRISEETGLSIHETFARCVSVLEWLSMWSPTGEIRDERQAAFAAGTFRSRAKAVAFGKAFVSEFVADGKCIPFLTANGALINTRRRQRAIMAKRRGADGEGG
jgi:hypothetical protein